MAELSSPTRRFHLSRIVHSETRFSKLFKEMFLVTASELADSIQEPLTSMGTLFDEILSTGTENRLPSARIILRQTYRPPSQTAHRDVEANNVPVNFGRGQVLFLVRQVSRNDALRLQACGFRFARVMHIVDILARTMEVNKQHFEGYLSRMRDYMLLTGLHDGPVNLGLFALRPLINRGFEVVVRKGRKDRLPLISLPVDELKEWQANILDSLDDCTVNNIREQLRGLSISSNKDQKRFASQLLEAIASLSDQVKNSFFEDARLVAKPLRMSEGSDSNQTHGSHIIALRHVMDAHEHHILGEQCDVTPLKFFLCRQHVPPFGMPDEVFSQKLRVEFAHCIDQRLMKESAAPSSPSRFNFCQSEAARSPGLVKNPSLFAKSPRRAPSFGCYPLSKDDSSERSLVRSPTKEVAHIEGNHLSDAASDTKEDTETKGIEMNESKFFNISEGPTDGEEETYADKLLATTLNDQRKQ